MEAPLVALMVSVYLPLPQDAMDARAVQMEAMKWLAHVCSVQ